MARWSRLTGETIPPGEAITPGALGVDDSTQDIVFLNFFTYQFLGNTNFAFDFPAGLIAPRLLAMIGLEGNTSNEGASVPSVLRYAGVDFATAQQNSIATGANHQRTGIYDLNNPAEGSNVFELEFTTPAEVSDGTLVLVVASNSQPGIDDESGNAVLSSSVIQSSFDSVNPESVTLEIVSASREGADTWSPNNGQSIVINGSGDNGSTTSQNAGMGYKYIDGPLSLVHGWTFSGSSTNRLCMSMVCISKFIGNVISADNLSHNHELQTVEPSTVEIILDNPDSTEIGSWETVT